ncbi:MAG: VOC family protein [Candidatus Bathyarchaeia archaeon]
MKIGHVTLLVKDFDEAAKFYVEKLGFMKRQDTKFWGDMRWVTVSPKDQPDLELTFVLADTEEKRNALGKQAGDHVFMTLDEQAWGVEVVFEDLYGNPYDLVQRNKQ